MKERVSKIREMMQLNNIDAALVFEPQNRRYLSGFTGSFGYLFITQSKQILITDFRYINQAKIQTEFEIIKYENNLLDIIYNLIVDNNISILGIEENYITYDWFKKLSDKLKVNYKNIDEIIKELRLIKDNSEIQNIKQAVGIGEASLKSVLNIIKPGVTEREIALELEYLVKKNGADGLSFDTIVASGTNSALPHANISDKKIEYGDFVVIDFGCKVNGYCSDMTRTFVVGKASEEQKKLYNIVLDAQKKALDYINEEKNCGMIDKVARDYISRYGYGENFGHSLGHGVGLDIHEAPTLSTNVDKLLQPGMVVTVEPGIYIENFGGVRIEDMVIIRNNTLDNLMTFSKDLIIV